ncbi:hypothetical protein [Clostridium sp. Marseille-Q2269]|uniref:hypothetical protein n=1 Tax=Clostridium sp. Marseille-Q2269 TaxID=2942205 RepID=UPI0020737DE0|nr:hypothetical protein [Clostridium sp. Marseille-Q2269]
MKEMNVKDKKIIIRKANRKDAKKLINYLNIIGGESDFLTFAAGEFRRSVYEEEQFIDNVLERKNALFID